MNHHEPIQAKMCQVSWEVSDSGWRNLLYVSDRVVGYNFKLFLSHMNQNTQSNSYNYDMHYTMYKYTI